MSEYVIRELHGPEADMTRRMMAVIDALDAFQVKYARHNSHCRSLLINNIHHPHCDCGYDAALEKIRKLRQE